MNSPAFLQPRPGQDVLAWIESVPATMFGPAAGELVLAVDAARRAGTLANRLLALARHRPAHGNA